MESRSVKCVPIAIGILRISILSLLFTFAFLLLPSALLSQHTRYWIQFTDKNNSPYSVSSPSAFLSARAIQRRTNQGISVVQNDLPVNPAYADSIKNVPNVTLLNRSKWFNAVTVYTTDTNALNLIKSFSFVANTKPVQRHKGSRKLEEDSYKPWEGTKQTLPSVQSYNYGPSFHQIDMVNGVCLHDLGYDGNGMQIAVLDAGFWRVDSLPAFDSLRTNGQILGTRDFVDKDTMVYDAHEHGMMVLSLMGGNMPGQIVGTAPKAKFWLLRTEEVASEYVVEEDNWVAGAEFADSVGVDIFNTSLGYTEFDDSTQNHTYADMDGNTTRISIATDIAASKGILPVNSAGNSGSNPWYYIGAPADADSVLAVGAVDSMRICASFSSRGPSFDGRVKPNVAAMGQDVYIASPSGGIGKGSGTSFSSPITAGMAACLWQAHPTSTNMQLFNAIQQSADRFNNPDTLTGHGIPDYCFANSLLAVDEPADKPDDVLSVYPNPFSEFTVVSVKGLNAYGLELSVYDILGNKVHSQILSVQKVTLDLKLAKRVYTVEVKDKDRSYSAKLVKY